MEWVVGQWVDYRGEKAKIEKIDNALTVRFANGSSIRLCLDTEFVKPFQWQVGRKYKTTLEGVTATINIIDDGNVGGIASDNEGVILWWDAATGMLGGYKLIPRRVPHLLPFLADEPSKPGPTLTEPQQLDPINPQHYRTHPSGIECIQVAEHMSYCLGNAIKYLWRAGKKDDAVQDLKKAAWYLQREIARLEKQRNGGAA